MKLFILSLFLILTAVAFIDMSARRDTKEALRQHAEAFAELGYYYHESGKSREQLSNTLYRIHNK